MISNADRSVIQVLQMFRELRGLEDEAKRALDGVLPLIVGRDVIYGGMRHRITHARSGAGNHIDLTGVRVRKGKAGVRQFFAGYLDDFSDLLEPSDG